MIVASLYQMPVDPFEQVTYPPAARLLGPQPARPPDPACCPRRSADDGTAYMMQLSIIGDGAPRELLDRHGYQARVVDFCVLRVHDLFNDEERPDHTRGGASPTPTT